MDGLLDVIKTLKTEQKDEDDIVTISTRRYVPTEVIREAPAISHTVQSPLQPKAEHLLSNSSQPASNRVQLVADGHSLTENVASRPETKSPEDCLEILKSKPDDDSLHAATQYLLDGTVGKQKFNVHLPSVQGSQLLNTLMVMTIPEQWHRLRGKELNTPLLEIRSGLISVLTSVSGIGALLMQINSQVMVNNEKTNPLLEDYVDCLGSVLMKKELLVTLVNKGISLYTVEANRRTYLNEVTSQLAGSRILNTLSRAFSACPTLQSSNIGQDWLSDGLSYSEWLANNILTFISRTAPEEKTLWNLAGVVLKRGMVLGWRIAFAKEFIKTFLRAEDLIHDPIRRLISSLPPQDQKKLFASMLSYLQKTYLPITGTISISDASMVNISGMAGLLSALIEGNQVLQSYITQCLTQLRTDAVWNISLIRSVSTTISKDVDKLEAVVQGCLTNFSDKLAIQHNFILNQELIAATILLTVGYLNRLDHQRVVQMSRSTAFLQAVSNRLAASIPRARYLGMLVGTGVSNLVDEAGKTMNFGIDEMNNDETREWLGLMKVDDQQGSMQSLFQPLIKTTEISRTNNPSLIKQIKTPQKAKPQFVKPASKQISANTADDLRPYAKPDDDPSDSDEDPTLINRSKPTAPVYIIDLIKYLGVSDKYDTVELALKTAPSLIRRKATFGTELSENILPLASALLNLQEGMSQEKWQKWRLDALIACMVSQPKTIGPWIASMYFEGDFSLAQRACLLTVVGLGSRELAGYEDGQTSPASRGDSTATFPSNLLPPNLAAIYSPVDNIAKQIGQSTIQPMALAAADSVTGPDILKVRTFSSRINVERDRKAKVTARSKRIPGDLHTILTTSIYLPLCCRMSLILSSNASRSYAISNSTIFEPHIIRLFLQTLTLVLHSLGPHAKELNTVTRETIQVIMTMHMIPKLAHDPVILPSLLQLFLTTIDLNVEAGSTAEERLVTDFGTDIAELIRWVVALEDSVAIPEFGSSHKSRNDGSEGISWKVLVAGIRVKWHEIGRKFQGRMLGLMGPEYWDQ